MKGHSPSLLGMLSAACLFPPCCPAQVRPHSCTLGQKGMTFATRMCAPPLPCPALRRGGPFALAPCPPRPPVSPLPHAWSGLLLSFHITYSSSLRTCFLTSGPLPVLFLLPEICCCPLSSPLLTSPSLGCPFFQKAVSLSRALLGEAPAPSPNALAFPSQHVSCSDRL